MSSRSIQWRWPSRSLRFGRSSAMTNEGEKKRSMQSRVEQLSELFLVRSLKEVGVMQEHLRKLASGEVESLSQLRHLAHKMNGTGATLGFGSLSERAGVVERLVDLQPQGTIPDPG